jgi:uncharacterized protein (DUF433 family)
MVEIIVDKNVRHGKPIIQGTRITVDEVLRMLEQGMTYAEVEKEFGIQKEEILAVIKYAASLVHGEEVHSVSANA